MAVEGAVIGIVGEFENRVKKRVGCEPVLSIGNIELSTS